MPLFGIKTIALGNPFSHPVKLSSLYIQIWYKDKVDLILQILDLRHVISVFIFNVLFSSAE